MASFANELRMESFRIEIENKLNNSLSPSADTPKDGDQRYDNN